MVMGMVSTAILTDIANAVRVQNGGSDSYTPAELGPAVAALDGTRAGVGMAAEAPALARGACSSRHFDAIAAAIRAQNGLETKYLPSEMAAAILALEWDVGLKPRAVMCADGTLEFNYLERRVCNSSTAAITDAWEVSLAGYGSSGARPWNGGKLGVTRVAFDSSWAQAGCQSCKGWFTGCVNLVEVIGFENVAGTPELGYMFSSCTSLESVYARGFDASAVTGFDVMFYGCERLVGAKGYVPSRTSSKAALGFGDEGALTDPDADARVWAWAHVYADKTLVIGGAAGGDGREVLASGRVCVNAKYEGLDGLAWNGRRREVLRVEVLPGAAGAAETVNMNYWFQSMGACTEFSGLGNLGRPKVMKMTFAGCKAVTSLDLRGMDPCKLSYLFYTFSDCVALTTILVDATWVLPEDCAGGGTFSGCDSLVGGAGSRLADASYDYAYNRMRIDKGADGRGYLTAG